MNRKGRVRKTLIQTCRVYLKWIYFYKTTIGLQHATFVQAWAGSFKTITCELISNQQLLLWKKRFNRTKILAKFRALCRLPLWKVCIRFHPNYYERRLIFPILYKEKKPKF